MWICICAKGKLGTVSGLRWRRWLWRLRKRRKERSGESWESHKIQINFQLVRWHCASSIFHLLVGHGFSIRQTGGEWALTFTLTHTHLRFKPRASSSFCNSQFYFHFITRNKDKLHKICAPRFCTNGFTVSVSVDQPMYLYVRVWISCEHTHSFTWPTPWATSAFLCKLCRRQAKTSGKYPLTKSRKSQSQKQWWSRSWVHRAWNY